VNLPRGRDNARTYADLADDYGTTPRAVQAEVQERRLAGEPIASSEDGVWLTDDPAELLATFDALRRRVTSQMRTAWAVRSTARRLRADDYEQTEMFTAA
jgi:hypothetical protein